MSRGFGPKAVDTLVHSLKLLKERSTPGSDFRRVGRVRPDS